MRGGARPDAVADLHDSHGRHDAERGREFGGNGGPGGRDEFIWLVDLFERDAAEDLERCKRGNREAPMRAIDPAPAIREFRNDDAIDLQVLDADAGADDVRDGIQGADLVKSHLFGRLAMDLALGDGDAAEDADRAGFDERGKIARFDQAADLGKASAAGIVVMVVVTFVGRMGMLVLVGVHAAMLMLMLMLMLVVLILRMDVGRSFMDAEPDSFHILAFLPLEMHVEISDVELREFPFEGGRIDAGVAESADRHVAADAGKAIEIQDSHRRMAWDKRFVSVCLTSRRSMVES